jgi:hypothetical protein
MNYYSYLVEHDFGLAPNPFGGYCTLSVCKPQIRKSSNLHVGDWIIGTGSKALTKTFGRNLKYHLVYAMQVSEIISMEDYWMDQRFKCKKPILNGSLPLVYGDNFYHKDVNGDWIQIDSAHSNNDGSANMEHLQTDISGQNTIISDNFYYFGQSAPHLPQNLRNICHTGIGQKLLTSELGAEFISWLTNNFEPKIYGKPINWVIYNQQRLF